MCQHSFILSEKVLPCPLLYTSFPQYFQLRASLNISQILLFVLFLLEMQGQFSINLAGTGMKISSTAKWLAQGNYASVVIRRSQVSAGTCLGFSSSSHCFQAGSVFPWCHLLCVPPACFSHAHRRCSGSSFSMRTLCKLFKCWSKNWERLESTH